MYTKTIILLNLGEKWQNIYFDFKEQLFIIFISNIVISGNLVGILLNKQHIATRDDEGHILVSLNLVYTY